MSADPASRWAIRVTSDVREWLRCLRQTDVETYRSVNVAIRIIFVFDLWSQGVLLVAGNKAGDWSGWYQTAIPAAEIAYERWLALERKRREGS